VRQLAEPLRAIPADHEAERAVLGAIILDHDAYHKVMDKVRVESFDLPRHQTLFRACEELTTKQQAITLITLKNYLEEHGQLEAVGGVGFIAEVADSVPTAAHVEHHAGIVKNKFLARTLIRTAEGIVARGYEASEPVAQLLEEAEREILRIGVGHADAAFSSVADELEATVEYIQQVQEGRIVGVRTGFQDLDRLTGGFSGGELVILAARPSLGKTALALNVARNHAIDAGGCVGFFSLEMTKRELMLRVLLGEAQVDNTRFSNGMLSERDWRAITRAASKLQEARVFLDDSMAVTASELAGRARRLHHQHQLSLIVVDYIQLIQGREKLERREEQVADISRSLKFLAKDLDLPIIALSQLNRGPEGRPDKRPQLNDLRESGAIEQDADVVMFIYRDEVYHEDSPDLGIAEVHIAKQRNGAVGTVKLQFDAQYGRFHNLAGREPAPPEAGFASELDVDDDAELGPGLGLDSDLPYE
jgi:replicative DNA helicase